ncbi:MAG: DUF2851 family protein [Chloroflexi bacterium]|nr:DUF2851 family protein [Chloroflexota bacterium]
MERPRFAGAHARRRAYQPGALDDGSAEVGVSALGNVLLLNVPLLAEGGVMVTAVREAPAPRPWPAATRAGDGAAGPDDGHARRGGARLPPPDERALAALWEGQELVDLPLRTIDGQALEVVSPGHRAPGGGPDFRDAVLRADDGALWQGDVELHGRAADWRAHGHDRDASYDGVVAHLVLDTAGAPARRRDGSAIPTIVLGPHLPPPGSQRATIARPCRAHRGAALDRGLAALSLERLEGKAQALAAAGAPAEPALYGALLAALGHPHNRGAYAALAARLPLDALRPLAALALPARIWQLEARLLGAAGLLPAPTSLPRPDAARARAMRRLAVLHPPLAWRTAGLRPANRPARRLVGAAHVLGRALPAGLAAYLTAPLALATAAARWRALLARLAVVDQTGFWAERTALGRPLRRPLPALVGPARAAALVLDVVLPWAFLSDRARAVETWSAAPPLATTWKERHIQRAAGAARLRGGAVQQGALHVFARWCHRYDCAACPLGGGGPAV